MNTIEKLNKIINYIESNKDSKREHTAINFDDIDLNNLNLEIVVGSKVNIQSNKNNLKLDSNIMLENYLKSISNYKIYKEKSPRYLLKTSDLNLDVNLEIKQKFLIEKVSKLRKTPDDIKKDINITLLENLKTSIFLYNNINKERMYKAQFNDLTLDIELEYKKVKRKVKKIEKHLTKPKEGLNLDKISLLRKKLENIEKFRKSEKFHKKVQTSDLDINVTISKTGEQLISLNKKNKINKLKQLLESINSYKEKRNELY